jgi:hypothetical protein
MAIFSLILSLHFRKRACALAMSQTGDDGDHDFADEEGDHESEDVDLDPSSEDEDERVTKKPRTTGPASKSAKPASTKSAKSSGATKAAAPKAKKPAAGGSGSSSSKPGAPASRPGGGGSAAGAASVAVPGALAPISFKKATTAAEAEATLLAYLKRGNRPYSALNVFDNLHGAVGKTGASCCRVWG